MAKKNDLKNSMSAGLTGGLDSLIQSTAGQKEAQKPKKAKTVHCNFVMDETYHQNLKLIAIRKGDSLSLIHIWLNVINTGVWYWNFSQRKRSKKALPPAYLRPVRFCGKKLLSLIHI